MFNFSYNHYQDALSKDYCESCLSKGFRTSFNDLRETYGKTYLLQHPELIEANMFIKHINNHK